MKINEVIKLIKSKHYNINHFDGKQIDEAKTKDKILYGNGEQECTGIVTCIYASIEVIRKAKELGANLIISHECCFWNHGDHTDWLEDNLAFQGKKKLLDEAGIVVWRDHDYIHSGIDIDGKWCDGIFYGLMKELAWEKYLLDPVEEPMTFKLPETSVKELADYLMDKMGLDSLRIMGNTEKKVSKVHIAFHILGPKDNEITKKVNDEEIDAIMVPECTDYTTALYCRDAAQLGYNKTVLAVGHFNIEEPGMKYFADYLPKMIGDKIPVTFVKAGDSYKVFKKGE